MNIDALTKVEKLNTIKVLEDLMLSPGWRLFHAERTELEGAKKRQALEAVRTEEHNKAALLIGTADGLWMSLNTPAVLIAELSSVKKT